MTLVGRGAIDGGSRVTRRAEQAPAPQLLVDGHVHFHACFTWTRFLDAAAANFSRARRHLKLTNDSPGCLMFTESAGIRHFRALQAEPALLRTCGWHVDRLDDDCSMRLSRADEASMLLVAGRQIVTAERLEVLALGYVHEPADGLPIRDVLRAITDDDGVPVIPWGVGKWHGGRGRVVRDLIETAGVPFFLGDNAGRARTLPRPRLFAVAERHGVTVLPGSDPLALPAHVTRVASYGFALRDWERGSHSAAAVRRAIRAQPHPRAFGDISSLPQMIRSQIELRWRRRVRHAAAAGRLLP